MQKIFATDSSVIPLILRLVLGLVMFPHGAQKLLGWFGGSGLQGTIAFFSQMGIPAPLTLLVIIAETAGAVCLIIGFLTRFAAFGIMSNMIGAIFLVHWPHGFFMNWFGKQSGEGFEYHLLAIAIALAVLISGGGALSADGAIARRIGCACPSPREKRLRL